VRRRPGRARRWGVGLLGALLASTLLGAPPAAADPDLATARAEATRLRAQVEVIRLRAEQATQRYDGLAAGLAGLTTREGLARRQLDETRATRRAAQQTVDERARAIYMAGGSLGLYATVLEGTDLTDLATRYQSVRAVLAGDGLQAARADAHVEDAAGIATRLMRLADRRAVLTGQAQAVADEINALLARESDLLAGADATVRALARQAQARDEALAAAHARTQLSALGVLGQGGAPAGSVAAGAIEAASSVLGSPYQWGAEGPDRFDCSGLTSWAYARAGLRLPRVAAQQWWSGPRVALEELRPGDLLFWATDTSRPATIHHVALYVGRGQMIEAPYTGARVRVVPVRLAHLIGAVRPTA
jgi:cell wall-associated NlpC family hydrolase